MKGPCLVLALLSLLLPSTLSAATAELENEARLLVQKQLLNKYVVESLDVVIKYSIFNIGGVTASNVILKDLSLGPDFDVCTHTHTHLSLLLCFLCTCPCPQLVPVPVARRDRQVNCKAKAVISSRGTGLLPSKRKVKKEKIFPS
jgi:hypothetical protein